jgi:hypothetical protein
MEPGRSIGVNDKNESFRKTDNYGVIGNGFHDPALDYFCDASKTNWLS